MRGLETSVVRLRHEVFKEVAKVAYESAPEEINNDIEAIPYTITPTEVPQYRESIYRERGGCALPWACPCAPRISPCTLPAGWIRAIFPISITSRR